MTIDYFIIFNDRGSYIKDYWYQILKQLLVILARSGTKNYQMVIRVIPSAICNFAMRIFCRVHKYGFWYHVFLEEFFAHEEKMTLRPHVGNCRNFAKKLESPTKKQCQKSIGGNIWKKARTSNNIKTLQFKQIQKFMLILHFLFLVFILLMNHLSIISHL